MSEFHTIDFHTYAAAAVWVSNLAEWTKDPTLGDGPGLVYPGGLWIEDTDGWAVDHPSRTVGSGRWYTRTDKTHRDHDLRKIELHVFEYAWVNKWSTEEKLQQHLERAGERRADKANLYATRQAAMLPQAMATASSELLRLQQIMADVRFPGYTFETGQMAGPGEGISLYLRVRYDEPDVMTGVKEEQVGRVWHVPVGQTVGQIVQTCLKAILTSLEHRAREHLTYKGKPVLQPHLDIETVWQLLPARPQTTDAPLGELFH